MSHIFSYEFYLYSLSDFECTYSSGIRNLENHFYNLAAAMVLACKTQPRPHSSIGASQAVSLIINIGQTKCCESSYSFELRMHLFFEMPVFL